MITAKEMRKVARCTLRRQHEEEKSFLQATRKLPTFYLPLGLISSLKKIARWTLLIFFNVLYLKKKKNGNLYNFHSFNMSIFLEMKYLTFTCWWISSIFYNKELAAKREKENVIFLQTELPTFSSLELSASCR